MTSDFQQQRPSWDTAYLRSAPEPQHGRKADKAAPKIPERPQPKRAPAY